jgi:YegS/Rv2252/BmrU family lipid kinase
MIRRLHLIANPKGGVGDNEALAKTAERILGDQGIETSLHLTQHAGHAGELVECLDCGEDEAICGIGGDGTMHELVNGMMHRQPETRVPLTLLPGGTGNAFLRDLECLDPKTVLDRIAANARQSIDLFEVTVAGHKHYGFNIVGWGLFSAANQLAESLRKLGRRRYDIAALLRMVQNRRYRGTLEIDGEETVEGGFSMLTASNTVHTGEGTRLAPKAQLDDGKLDLIYIREATRVGLLRLFSKIKDGRHIDQPGVHYLQVSHFKLTTDEPLPINLDGELIESGSFEVRVLPGALDLLL